MDAANVNNLESEKKNEESLSYHSPNMSSDWQMNSTNLENPSMGLISQGNHMANSSSCSGAPMVDSFCSTIWDQSTSSQNLSYADINVRQSASTSQSFSMSWNPSNSMLKGGMFLPNVPGMLPQIPADSGFIERAARFSSFSGGNFSDMLNPFTIPEPMNPYFRGVAPIQRPQEMNMAPILKDVSLPDGHGATEVSPFKNEKKNESLAGPPEMESDDAGCSGRGGQEELEGGGGESSAKGLGSRKRKRIGQDVDVDVDENKGVPEPSVEATKNQNPTSTTTKPGGRHGTQGPQTSDPTKEDYIHVRARRGQATNSHSLAERVRREKISERMKFLQDLVPGCSKVTGKAVMLDEIINYVQSLQRQVEFLSMKLATVNPRLNFNIESLLTKDILQSRAGPSSSLAFPPDMNMHYPGLHPPPTGLMHAGLSGLESSSDALRRSICSQFTNMAGGYKEATSQVPNAWEDELHNVVQMGLNSISPLGSQDLSASLPPGHMKPEQ